MDEWLSRQADELAASTGRARESLELSDADVKTLLDLARIGAHASGERTNAPLLCYLVGRAQGAGDLESLAEAVRRSTS